MLEINATVLNIVVNQGITFKHILQHFVCQRVAWFGEVLAQLGKTALDLTQGAFNRDQIKTMCCRHWHS